MSDQNTYIIMGALFAIISAIYNLKEENNLSAIVWSIPSFICFLYSFILGISNFFK